MINSKILKIFFCFIFLVLKLDLLHGQDTTKIVKINNFVGIAVKSGIDIVLTQSNEEKIEIKGLKTFAEDVSVTKNDSGILKIEMVKFTLKNWKWGKNESLKVFISFKTLNHIKISECATVLTDSVINLENLNITIEDGSEMKLNLKANNLGVEIESGSTIYLFGQAKNFNLIGNNVSNVNALNLQTNTVNATLNNGTDAQLYATEYINVTAKNGSDVRYKGTPLKKKFKTTNFSTVKQSIKL